MLRHILPLLFQLTAVHAAIPRPLADVPIRTPDKKNVNLKQYRGKVLLVVLISTSCRDCIRTIDILNRMQRDLGPRGFQAVAAASNENAPFEVGPFAQRYRPIYPFGYLDRDATLKIADVPKDVRPFVPIAIFVDRKGIVRVQYYGDDPVFKDEERMFRMIADSLLKSGEPK